MPELADMRFFVQSVSAGSLSAAGRELGFSPAVGSKRLARLEADLGVRLVQRNSRRFTLTEEGQLYHDRCLAILAEVADAEAMISKGRQAPHGILRVAAPIALGRRWIGPALAEFARNYPEVKVQLSLSDNYVDLIEGGWDCAVRIGGDEDSRFIARKLADNRRVICASPDYLKRRGTPLTLEDLRSHDCLLMSRSGMHADWLFHPIGDKNGKSGKENRDDRGERGITMRIEGRLIADNGEQTHDWALAGLGLMRRSIWDVAEDLNQGRLVQVLTDWTSESTPIRIIFASRQFLPARTRLFIDQLVAQFDAASQAGMLRQV